MLYNFILHQIHQFLDKNLVFPKSYICPIELGPQDISSKNWFYNFGIVSKKFLFNFENTISLLEDFLQHLMPYRTN